MLGALTSLLWAAAVAVHPASTVCPSAPAIAAELAHLGVLAALAELGSSEVMVEGGRLRIVFRGRDGAMLGEREMATPATCSERVATAAVFIAAWVGNFGKGPLPQSPAVAEGARPPASEPAPAPEATGHAAAGAPEMSTLPAGRGAAPRTDPVADGAPPRTVPAPTPPARPEPPPVEPRSSPAPAAVALARTTTPPVTVRKPPAEVAAWLLATSDGDATAIGGGMSASYRFARRAALAVLVETSREREVPLDTAVAIYRLSRLGAGASVLHTSGAFFMDAGLFPELTLLSVRGRGLAAGRPITTWGLDVDVRARLGLVAGPIAPFVFLSGCAALRTQRLTLDDSEESRTFSRFAVNAGVGLALLLGGKKGL